MNVTEHAKKLATAFGGVDRANQKVVANIRDFINEASMSANLIENYLKEFGDNAKGKVKDSSLKVYKSQVKKILNLAIDHKQQVLDKASEAGNLNQWYQACLEKTPAKRNATTKVNKPKAEPLPKLGAEDKEPSETTSPIDQFKTALRAMLDAGMSLDQIQAIIDAETKVAEAA